MKCRECKGQGSTQDPATGENLGCLNCAGWGVMNPHRALPTKSQPVPMSLEAVLQAFKDFRLSCAEKPAEKPFLGILHEAKCIICGGLISLCPHGPKAKDPKLEMKAPFFDLDHDDLGSPTYEV